MTRQKFILFIFAIIGTILGRRYIHFQKGPLKVRGNKTAMASNLHIHKYGEYTLISVNDLKQPHIFDGFV